MSQATATAPSLPDVNIETHPFAAVQQALDRVAYFGMYAVADPGYSGEAWLTPTDRTDYFGLNGGYGIDVRCHLHRFDSGIDAPTRGDGLQVAQVVGERIGDFRSKFLLSRGEPAWAPGVEPRTLNLDVWKSQSFVMLDTGLSFSGGADSFEGYGIGRTYPVMVRGRPVLVACAVGDLFGGRGKLWRSTGTFALNGTITPALGFQGSLSCRIPDPEGTLHVQTGRGQIGRSVPLESHRQERLWESDPATYVLMRGEKESPEVRTEYGPHPGEGLVSLVTPAVMKSVRFESSAGGQSGPLTRSVIGDKVAELIAEVELDILARPGTPEAPNFFRTRNVYTFVGRDGRPVGSITADVELGRSFSLEFPDLPGQAGMRYGGIGLVVDGTGSFRGVRGSLAVNSAIGVAPHALSMLNVLRIVDPDRKYREGVASKSRAARTGGRWAKAFPAVSKVTYMFEAGRRKLEPTTTSGPRSASAPKLPDLNAETYPFDQVLGELDKAAFFDVLCTPAGVPSISDPLRGGGIGGLAMSSKLHRFSVGVAISDQRRLAASNIVGEPVGNLTHRWVFVPDDYYAAPGSSLSGVAFDPRRSQRFVMSDGVCSFGSGADGFRGFGTGMTIPLSAGERSELLVGAVGNVTQGFGRLVGAIGTYVLAGRFSAEVGYQGDLLVRVANPNSELRAPMVPSIEPGAGPTFGLTYIVFRGQKRRTTDRTELIMGPDGKPRGFSLSQELREVQLGFAVAGGLRTQVTFGPMIGRMESEVRLNFADLETPGTGESPIPFESRNRFTFVDSGGREIGSFVAEEGEGRTFDLALPSLPGQKALRFGAFQRLAECTGDFSGMTGLLTDNSAVGIAPHATATMYTLCIVDPDGKYRAAIRRASS